MRLWHESGQCSVPIGLIVCPAIARLDLRREIQFVWPEARVLVLGDNDKITVAERAERVREIYERAEHAMTAVNHGAYTTDFTSFTFIISSYEMINDLVTAHEDAFPQLLGPFCADEAHNLKKAKSLRSRILRPFIARSEITFLTTGTPIHDKPIDLHNLLDLCSLGKFGSLYTFARKYFNMVAGRGGFGETIGKLLDKEGLSEAIKDYVLSRDEKEAYGELPPRIWKLVRIESSRKQELRPPKSEAAVYKALRDSVPYKIKPTVELALELDEPLVIYTYEKQHAALIASKLAGHGTTVTLATGDVVASKRAKLIEAWKGGSSRVLVCTMDAVKESATLTRASAMIFADVHYTPNVMLQNAWRIDPSRQPEDQRRPARYYVVVVEGSIDEQVAERNVEKIEDAQGVINKGTVLSGLSKALTSHKPPEESMEDMLSDLTARINARGARMEGLL